MYKGSLRLLSSPVLSVVHFLTTLSETFGFPHHATPNMLSTLTLGLMASVVSAQSISLGPSAFTVPGELSVQTPRPG